VAIQPWVGCVNNGAPWQTASGTTLNTAATATISPEAGGGIGADPQIYPWNQGLLIRGEAFGVYTCGSTATNLTLALWASATGTAATGGTSLATTGAFAMPVSQTGLFWSVRFKIQVRASAQGSSTATVYTHAFMLIQTAAYEATLTSSNHQILPMPATSGPTAADVDTTVAHTVALVATLSQATGSPSITCTEFDMDTFG
jgi:hypothetical protein